MPFVQQTLATTSASSVSWAILIILASCLQLTFVGHEVDRLFRYTQQQQDLRPHGQSELTKERCR